MKTQRRVRLKNLLLTKSRIHCGEVTRQRKRVWAPGGGESWEGECMGGN